MKTYLNTRKDGTPYHDETTIFPITGASGEVVNYVVAKRDITEKARLESIAEALNSANNIGYVFSGIRHEIGNPTNSLKMTLSVLSKKLDTCTTEFIREYVARCTTAVARIEYLLKSLKSFNLYENPECQSVEIRSFMEKFLPLVENDISGRGIKLSVRIAPGVASGYFDPRALQQILLNVLTNAIDAVKGVESPFIEITAAEAGDMVNVGVSDNGKGISKEQHEQLFKPFYTTKPEGTGLGLVIAKKMLAKMNGTIEISGRQAGGTLVDIFIPKGRMAEDEQAP